MEKNTAHFMLSYDGPALANHEMDVKDLAPALLAVGELLEEANKIINGEKVGVDVKIKSAHDGSISIDLSLVQNIYDQAVSLFSGDGASAVANAQSILGIIGLTGTGGVIATIKWLRKRKIKSVVQLEDGSFEMIVEDGEARVVSKAEISLFGFFKVRKSIEAFVRSPLKKEGVEKVHFGNPAQVITKDESDYFEIQEEEELLDETEIKTNLQIVGISFQEGGKWRFNDGNAVFFADILDESFLDKVGKNEKAFAKDDILTVMLKRRQFLADGVIKTEYAVKEVLEHRSAAIQIKLPFSK